jgi:hypothetical protein
MENIGLYIKIVIVSRVYLLQRSLHSGEYSVYMA